MFNAFNRDNEFVNDFEAMLAKKREEGSKRRKRRDIDIINDNDDIIDQLIQDMRAAAEVLPNCHINLEHYTITHFAHRFNPFLLHLIGRS